MPEKPRRVGRSQKDPPGALGRAGLTSRRKRGPRLRDDVTEDAGARDLNCGGLGSVKCSAFFGFLGILCFCSRHTFYMESSLQARLCPGLSIKIQRSNGERGVPRPGVPVG